MAFPFIESFDLSHILILLFSDKRRKNVMIYRPLMEQRDHLEGVIHEKIYLVAICSTIFCFQVGQKHVSEVVPHNTENTLQQIMANKASKINYQRNML